MFWTNPVSHSHLPVLGTIGVVVLLIVGGSGAGAHANQTGAADGTPANQNCAVSTARIGGLDVTQFFGIRGGAASFRQSFAAPSTVATATEPAETPAQQCIRLEVENPTPGDLVPVGGYVLAGFGFDPIAAANQGSGISSVQVFLDDPNQGGGIVGETSAASAASGKSFGLPSASGAAFADQFANSGFRLTVQIPSSAAGSPHALFVVALSSTGRVGTVALPVVVGNLTPAAPTRTP